MVWTASPRRSTPSPQARRAHHTRTTTARMETTDGNQTAQDPHRLHRLPPRNPRTATKRDTHEIVTGELRASKGARVVRTGDHWKRTRQGTSPVVYRCDTGQVIDLTAPSYQPPAALAEF